MGASGYIYHDNPSTGVNYWALNTDGSATFGCGKISFANDGSGYLANQNIKWDASGNVTMTGTINANAGTIGGFVIGQGRITVVPDSGKEHALRVLMAQYRAPDFPFSTAVIPRTTVLCLTVEHMTGKRRVKKHG